MRKGRMDEIFFVDLPDDEIRRAIFLIHVKKRSLDPSILNLAQLSMASEGFSGAEIEQAVISAIYTARATNQDVDQSLLIAELMNTRPLSVVMREKLAELRHWAAERTVNAHR